MRRSSEIFFLVFILCALFAENVHARNLTDKALAKIQPQVLEHFSDTGSKDLILLLDASGIAARARLQKTQAGLQYEDQAILRSKSNSYRDIKNSLMLDFDQDEIQQLYTYAHLPMMFANVTTPEALYRLLENDHVLQIFENAVHTLSLGETLPLIGQVESYAAGHGGQGTTVAVLDTGTDYERAAFGSCVSPGVPDDCKVIFAKDFTENDDTALDMNGHGTNVSGILLGVAPDTMIAALDIFTGNGIYTADAIAAIDWVIAHQATYNIVAMNMSFGLGSYENRCETSWAVTPFANARAVGVVPIVASGNDSQKDKVKSPACAPGAIIVGAVYDTRPDGSRFRSCASMPVDVDVVPCFSNSASFLDLMAPGVEVTAAGFTKTGTSMATPHVAGAYAVLKGESAYPGDSIEATIARLKNTGKQILDDRNGLMFPRVDLAAALFDLLPDQVPEISAFEPSMAAEGQMMQISGTGFRGVDEVLIGDTPAHQFTVNTSESISVDVGAGSSGEIRVATSLGSDSMPGFTFINSVRETEPNNDMALANPVNLSGERLAGGLSDQDDVDIFRFGFDPGEVSFGVKPVRSYCCSRFIRLTLQDGEGNVVASGQVDENVDAPVLLQANITQRGAYYLTVSETPDEDPVFENDYQITVPENPFTNTPPAFTSASLDVVFTGQTYTYPLQADDGDGDSVYYYVLSGPTGMSLDQQNNTITWQPDDEQAGLNEVELLVSDDFGGSDTQTFSIAVIDSVLLEVNATDGTYKNHVRVTFNLAEGATVYRVFRCQDAGETCGSPIGFTKNGVFRDMQAVPGMLYHYRVKACSPTKCGPFSTADTGFTAIAPARPTGIRATDGSFHDRVRVSFSLVNGATRYRVFRCMDTGQTCGLPVGYPLGSSFDDRGGENGVVYFYRVKACNSQHCGKFSVANPGYSSSEAGAPTEILERGEARPIPVLHVTGRWLLILMVLGFGFLSGYRAYRAGKLNLF